MSRAVQPVKKLTDAQRRLAEDNIRLVYKYMHRNQLDPDDWLDILLVDYVRAMPQFDPDKGAFSTFAFTVLQNSHYIELRRRRRQIDCDSLETPFSQHDGSELFLKDTVADTSRVADETVFSFYLNEVLTQEELWLLDQILSDVSQKDIAEKLAVRQPQVSRKLNAIRKKLIKCDCFC